VANARESLLTASVEILPGVRHFPGFLDRLAQEAMLGDIRDIVRRAPLVTPKMPRTGKPFSVRMTNCGALGWVSDVEGYRYQRNHPETGEPWPPMPSRWLDAWTTLASGAPSPQACLINFYAVGAKMGLHQDRDEEDISAPVVSLSLGDTALFRVGGVSRNAPTRSFRLQSGDAMILGGPSRLAFHGVDRIIPGTSTLLAEGGRINLTLRRVTPD
jgi:alkylated DNA repair protein (DNA oxidative demethylase)